MAEQTTGRGERVIARCYGGAAKVLVVYSWDFDLRRPKVYLTTAELLPEVLAGKSILGPIGFPIEDVFAFDDSFDLSNPDWSKLKLWRSWRR